MGERSQQLQQVRRRIREIDAELARRKSDYYNKGIEAPMKERAALESELADLRLVRLDMEDLEATRAANVRRIRGELMQQRLAELGLQHLFTECNAAAEAQVPLVEHSEVSHG